MAKARAPQTAKLDRIARIRRMVKEGVEDRELFAPGFVSHAPWDVAAQLREKRASAELDYDRAFSDLRVTVDDAVEENDTVVVKWRARGKWTGQLPFIPGVQATGRTFEFSGTNIYRFVKGQIVEKHSQLDLIGAVGSRHACGSAECIEAVQSIVYPF